MSVVGEAYVRIRPQTSGFRQEAEGGMRSQVAGLAKTVAATFAGVFAAQKLFDFGKQAIQEAALTQKATENIRVQFGAASDSVLKFGESAASSFGIARGPSEQFASQLGLVGKNLGLTQQQTGEMTIGLEKLAGSVGLIKGQDPAGFFHTLQLALLGNTRGLKQMGISVDTTAEKTYLLSHGIIDQTTKAITPAEKAMAIYGIATAHLGEFQREARKHSGDLADSQIKLGAEFMNIKDEIGTALLPTLANLATFLSENLPGAIHEIVAEFHTGYAQVQPLTDAFAASIRATTGFLVDHKTIVFDVVKAYLAYKVVMGGVNLVLDAARGAQSLFNTIMAAGAGAAATEAEATVTLTAALEANTAALQGQAIAAGEATAAQEGLAVAEAETGAAAEVASAGGIAQFGSGLVALAGGPLVVAAVGMAGLAAGMIYIAGNASDTLTNALSRVGDGFSTLSTRMNLANRARATLADTLRQVPEAKLSVEQARLNVQTAQANLHNKALNGTVLQRRQNELNLKQALQQLHTAQVNLNAAENRAHAAGVTASADAERGAAAAHRQTVYLVALAIQDAHAATTAALHARNLGGRGGYVDAATRAQIASARNATSLRLWVRQLDDQRGRFEKSNPLLAHNIGLLENYAKRIGRIPTKHETNVILNIRNLKEHLNQVYTLLNGLGVQTRRGGHNVGLGFVDGIVRGVQDRMPSAQQVAREAVLKTQRAMMEEAGIHSPSQLFRSNVGQPLIEGVISGIHDRQPNLLQQMVSTLQALMGPSRRNAMSIGRGVTTGIISGVGGLARNLGTVIINAVQGALDAARSHFGIKSPSMVWAQQLGQPLRDGIVHGMGGLEQMLVSRVTKAAQAAQAAAGGFGGGGGPTPAGSAATGANQRLGLQMMLAHGWPASQWGALQALWNRESGWNQYAKNPSSGAYGIPQSLPASKMASAGSDWMTNPATQIRWGLGYISGRYGSPAAAWQHELSAGWYKRGGLYRGGLGIAGETGPELVSYPTGSRVSSATDTRGMFDRLTHAIDQLSKRLDKSGVPQLGEVHIHSPALSPEGAARDFLNTVTRRVAMS